MQRAAPARFEHGRILSKTRTSKASGISRKKKSASLKTKNVPRKLGEKLMIHFPQATPQRDESEISNLRFQMPPMPVRRLQNFVYCPRLFYYQWVEDIFVDNADTVEGFAVHSKADTPRVCRMSRISTCQRVVRFAAFSLKTRSSVLSEKSIFSRAVRRGSRLWTIRRDLPGAMSTG